MYVCMHVLYTLKTGTLVPSTLIPRTSATGTLVPGSFEIGTLVPSTPEICTLVPSTFETGTLVLGQSLTVPNVYTDDVTRCLEHYYVINALDLMGTVIEPPAFGVGNIS